jgi:hypothetical protein
LIDYNLDTARKVLRWIISPDEPRFPLSADSHETNPTKAEVELGEKIGRVPSDNSDMLKDSKPSTTMTQSSEDSFTGPNMTS